jgi:hypothetical protein|uniref:HIT domain-containing protein n=1 Tax=Globisporangium ultimum (strain ATCC 200006 / CBS 805.95 / DAOM BR144) TaxID=431595 RepID=K3XBI6_GLOUD
MSALAVRDASDGSSTRSSNSDEQQKPQRHHHGKRLRKCLRLLHHGHDDNDSSSRTSKRRPMIKRSVESSGDSSFSSSSTRADEEEDEQQTILALNSPTIMHSLSDTEVMGGGISPTMSRAGLQRRRSTNSVDSTESGKSYYSTKRKGVKYGRDGAVVCCRFCDILHKKDEEFLYEDDMIAVFRPLSPVVESHILVVPRCHIRNVNMLTQDHVQLLSRMKQVAETVLRAMPPSSHHHHKPESSAVSSDVDYKFAFHTPPFNSIDHVHMHAFRKNEGSFGCFGSIKYRTETWWCRSFDQVVTRLGATSVGPAPRSSRRPSDESTAVSSRAAY